MIGNKYSTQCRWVCWAISAAAGVLALILLLSFEANAFASILVGIALAVLMALVLTSLFCSKNAAGQGDAMTASTPTGAAAAAAMAATGAGAASAGATSKDAGADSKAAKGAGADDKAAGAKAATGNASEAVKSGTLLKGEQEIAESKGSWKYQKNVDATTEATNKPAPVDSMADSASLFVSEDADAEAGAQVTPDYDGDGVKEGENEGRQPEALSGPRGGKADNLKEIKGVGPKLEKLLNEMGFYHFDQIANWTAQEIAWVNANLKGFKGRASRDEWVKQAKILASGGDTEFSKRVDDGDVY